MYFQEIRRKLTIVALSFMLIPSVAMTDQLVMQNGDIITGDISKIVDSKIFIKPAYGDEYAIDLAAVNSIEADQVFEVDLADGRKVEALFIGETNGAQTLMVEQQPLNVGMADLTQAIDPTLVPEVDPWAGSGEVGFVNTTGNTETVVMNARLNFVRTGKRWRHRFTGTAMMTSEDGIEENERYTMEVQSDRKLNEKSWLFGAFRWDADKFGSYDPQVSLTAGYGRMLMQSEKHELKGEIGAGYKKLTETFTGSSSREGIARFLLDDWWQIFPSTKWTNRLLVEAGSTNTFTQFNTGLSVSMSDRLAVKLGYEVRDNTKIPPGDSEHTDTISSVNLVYDF
jgi:putative salt-induced outer membrane protein